MNPDFSSKSTPSGVMHYWVILGYMFMQQKLPMQMLLTKIYRMFLHCQKLELVDILIKQPRPNWRSRIHCVHHSSYIFSTLQILYKLSWIFFFFIFFPILFFFMEFVCSLCTCLGFFPVTPVISVTVKKRAHWVSRRLQIASRCEWVSQWCTGELPAVRKVVILCYYAYSISLVKSYQ